MNGKIIVVTHKDYDMPQDEIYLPVCVGSDLLKLCNKFQADNTGKNISNLNETYCELTAIYWAWKNLDISTLDYVGVSHYRRHFSIKKRAYNLDKAISSREMREQFLADPPDTVYVTPKRTYLSSIEKHYIYSLKGYEETHARDIQRLRQSIQKWAPEYVDCAESVLKGHSAHMLNMFVMPSNVFDAYCSWLFPIIDEVVALSSDRQDQRRYAGALSEMCLDIWLRKNSLPVRELLLLETEPITFLGKVYRYLKRKI